MGKEFKQYESLSQALQENPGKKILLYNRDVLDVSEFQHPGSQKLIDENIGEDVQKKFDDQGHSEAAYDMIHHYKIAELTDSVIDPQAQSESKQKNSLAASKYINSLKEMEIHKQIDKKIDLSKPLLEQVKKLTMEEFKFFVKRPRFLENYDEFQLHSNYYFDLYKSKVTRNIWINTFIQQILAILLVYFSNLNILNKASLFMAGMILIWPLVEYYFHRIELHKEVNLKEDKSGKAYANLFRTHLCHHVYMKSKYRVALSIDFNLVAFLGSVYLLSFVIDKNIVLPISGGVFQGANLYDMLHYSFHHIDNADFGVKWINQHYQRMKQMHMVHHYRDNSVNFGVSTWWIDWLFGTYQDVKVEKIN